MEPPAHQHSPKIRMSGDRHGLEVGYRGRWAEVALNQAVPNGIPLAHLGATLWTATLTTRISTTKS